MSCIWKTGQQLHGVTCALGENTQSSSREPSDTQLTHVLFPHYKHRVYEPCWWFQQKGMNIALIQSTMTVKEQWQ